MHGKPRKRQTTSKQPAALPHGKPLIGAAQVVHRLRAKQFAGCEELPDAVIRTTATKAEKTRESIRYNYAAWKRWVASQNAQVQAFPAEPTLIARYLQDHAPPILETRSGGFMVDPEAHNAIGTRRTQLRNVAEIPRCPGNIASGSGLGRIRRSTPNSSRYGASCVADCGDRDRRLDWAWK